MKVKPDISHVLSKAAVLLDSWVAPHDTTESERASSNKLMSVGEEQPERRNDRRNSAGNMDEMMAALLSEGLPSSGTGTKDTTESSTQLN